MPAPLYRIKHPVAGKNGYDKYIEDEFEDGYLETDDPTKISKCRSLGWEMQRVGPAPKWNKPEAPAALAAESSPPNPPAAPPAVPPGGGEPPAAPGAPQG